jgi:hypothetical protein
MSSGYEDKTGLVECELRVFVRPEQRKVPETSDMSTFGYGRHPNGYQSTHKTCWRASGKEAKAYPTIRIPTNHANWGLPKQERHGEVDNGYDI